jgi:hypothetical protein
MYLTQMNNLKAIISLCVLLYQQTFMSELPTKFQTHMDWDSEIKFDDFEFKNLIYYLGFRTKTHRW